MILTPREFLSRLGFKRRGSNVVADVRAALERHCLVTTPDFADLDYETPFEIVYTEAVPVHIALLKSAREAADRAAPGPSLTVRDFLRKFGQERRGANVCKMVRDLLDSHGLTTSPPFEKANPDSYIGIVDIHSSRDLPEAESEERILGLIHKLESSLNADTLSPAVLAALVELSEKTAILKGRGTESFTLVDSQCLQGAREPRAVALPRFEPDFEYALIKLLAEVVMADGVAFANEDEAASTYILDHVASDGSDAERLLRLYSDCKYDEIEFEDIRDYLGHATPEDREALFDACVKIAWADGEIDAAEQELLRKICSLLDLDVPTAEERIVAHGRVLRTRAASSHVYTHIETVEVACGPIAELQEERAPEWLVRTIQLQAISYLQQKRAAKVSVADASWSRPLGAVDSKFLHQALSECRQLVETASGFIPSKFFRIPGPGEPCQDEATLFRLLLGQGSPLTARFLSFRVQPPKIFAETEIRRIASSSPALILYKLGSGNWVGTRLWGRSGASKVAKDDWAMIKRELVKNQTCLTDFEWEAVLEQARATGEQKIANIAEAALNG